MAGKLMLGGTPTNPVQQANEELLVETMYGNLCGSGCCEGCGVPLVEIDGKAICVVCDDLDGAAAARALECWYAEHSGHSPAE